MSIGRIVQVSPSLTLGALLFFVLSLFAHPSLSRALRTPTLIKGPEKVWLDLRDRLPFTVPANKSTLIFHSGCVSCLVNREQTSSDSKTLHIVVVDTADEFRASKEVIGESALWMKPSQLLPYSLISPQSTISIDHQGYVTSVR